VLQKGGDRRIGTITREVAAFGIWIHKAVGRASKPEKEIRGEGSQLGFKREHWMMINHRILQNPRTEIMEAKNEVRIRDDISFGCLRLDWMEVERKGYGAGDSGRSGEEARILERACFGSPPFSDSEGREAKSYWEHKSTLVHSEKDQSQESEIRTRISGILWQVHGGALLIAGTRRFIQRA
jgi:hypothetical protein